MNIECVSKVAGKLSRHAASEHCAMCMIYESATCRMWRVWSADLMGGALRMLYPTKSCGQQGLAVLCIIDGAAVQ